MPQALVSVPDRLISHFVISREKIAYISLNTPTPSSFAKGYGRQVPASWHLSDSSRHQPGFTASRRGAYVPVQITDKPSAFVPVKPFFKKSQQLRIRRPYFRKCHPPRFSESARDWKPRHRPRSPRPPRNGRGRRFSGFHI